MRRTGQRKEKSESYEDLEVPSELCAHSVIISTLKESKLSSYRNCFDEGIENCLVNSTWRSEEKVSASKNLLSYNKGKLRYTDIKEFEFFKLDDCKLATPSTIKCVATSRQDNVKVYRDFSEIKANEEFKNLAESIGEQDNARGFIKFKNKCTSQVNHYPSFISNSTNSKLIEVINDLKSIEANKRKDSIPHQCNPSLLKESSSSIAIKYIKTITMEEVLPCKRK